MIEEQQQANEWKEDNESLIKEFEFSDFRQAVAFINRIADAVHELDHQPEILIYSQNKVKVKLQTYPPGSITQKDRKLASMIDETF